MESDSMSTEKNLSGKARRLIEDFKKREATAVVIGIGYVGLPLAVEMCKAGFTVAGVDVDESKVKRINAGKSYILDVREEDIKELLKTNRFHAVSDFGVIERAKAISICVPTPLRKTKDPDISYIVDAVDRIIRYSVDSKLIVLESTTYPGTTEEIVLEKLKKNGLRVGHDFFLAFSPERVDPGNMTYGIKNTPKVIGGITNECTDVAKAFYEQFIDEVVPVSSARTAEMVKLLENTFRAVNIALANEAALMCDKLDLDVWEVLIGASSKPFGYMPFYPGPGLGGHCLPIDPYYLSWKLRTLDYHSRFIEMAQAINAQMPGHVLSKINDGLNLYKKSINGSKILVLGLTYKKDVNDIRESPALDIISLLMNRGAEVLYNDPYVSELDEAGIVLESQELKPALLRGLDALVITTDHSSYDYEMIVKNSRLIIDTRNAIKGINCGECKIISI